jgi:hypothetical protein
MFNTFNSSFQFGKNNISLSKSGLILYYDPNDTASYSGSGTTINSLVSPNLSGTLSNVTLTNPYFNFNGSTSQISIADSATLEPGSGNWTMEVWFNVASASTSGVMLGKFDNGGLAQNVSYSIRYSTARSLFAQFSNGSPATFVNSTTYTFSLDTWYQVVYVWLNNGGSGIIQTYVNGARIGSVNHSFASILNSTNPLYLGSYNGGEYSQYFNGKLGIVRLYNKTLSSSDVLSNYIKNKGLYGL